jgi:hypothetical protein
VAEAADHRDRAAPGSTGRILATRPGGFEAVSLGGFFAWVRHPFTDRPTCDVVRDPVLEHDMLVIPGTAFLADDRRMLRLSVGRIDEAAATTLARKPLPPGASPPPGTDARDHQTRIARRVVSARVPPRTPWVQLPGGHVDAQCARR